MEKKSLIVDGFVFPNEKEAQTAFNEHNNIEMIRQRTPISDPDAAYELYTKLIERDMFKTVVGYSFLYELRQRLVVDFGYAEEELPFVTLSENIRYDRISGRNQNILEIKLEKELAIKKKMTIALIALIAMVIAMFVIAAVNPNTGYINTENKILNKYATWQEELEQREQAVKEKEKQLNIPSKE